MTIPGAPKVGLFMPSNRVRASLPNSRARKGGSSHGITPGVLIRVVPIATLPHATKLKDPEPGCWLNEPLWDAIKGSHKKNSL